MQLMMQMRGHQYYWNDDKDQTKIDWLLHFVDNWMERVVLGRRLPRILTIKLLLFNGFESISFRRDNANGSGKPVLSSHFRVARSS